MKICYSNNGLTSRRVDEDYQPIEGERVFDNFLTPEQIQENFSLYQMARQSEEKEMNNLQIKQQLEALDSYIPRGLEDFLSASGFDISKLPQIQRDRLKQKQDLRAQIK